jgi:ABC-type molybdate transport system substrate-binding protein
VTGDAIDVWIEKAVEADPLPTEISLAHKEALMFRVFPCAIFGTLLVLSSPHSSLAQQQPVTAFAAASLQDALTGIVKKFTDQTGASVRFSFGSSAALARQIDEGAPADLFASADTDWMLARNLIKPQTRVDLLGNRLLSWSPRSTRNSRRWRSNTMLSSRRSDRAGLRLAK